MRSSSISIPVYAGLLLLGLVGLNTQAQASSYVVSTNTITNFSATFTGSVVFNPFTFSSDTAALNGLGTGGVGNVDAPASCINCAYSNSFTPHGAVSWYSYGDAQIMNSNVQSGAGAAASIGEVRLVNNGLGTASGDNTMIASFSAFGPTTLSFSFTAAPYMSATLGNAGGAVAANLQMTITITDFANNTVFNWSPNGAAGGITGGSETADPYSLNYGIGVSALPGSASYTPGTSGFAATTSSIAGGNYLLNISMKDTAYASAVPIPAAVWLLGSGLMTLAPFVNRRRVREKKLYPG